MSDDEPAFPCDYDMSTFVNVKQGMTIRDYFAAKAMAARAGSHYGKWHDLAREAYAIADAMLSARAKEAKP